MIPNAQRYFAMKNKAAKASHIEVSREEFIELFMAEGGSKDEAEHQAKIAVGLGSTVLIGDKMVGIKQE